MYVIKGLKSAVIIHFTERPKLQKKGSIACHPPAPPPDHQRRVTFMRVFFSRSALYVSVGRYVCPLYMSVIYIYGAECIYGAEQAIW